MKCKSCGMELKEDEDLYCNPPSYIERRAEEIFGASDDM